MDGIDPALNKIEAINLLAAQAGMQEIDPYWDMTKVLSRSAPRTNPALRALTAEAAGLRPACFMPAYHRQLPAANHASGLPVGFPAQAGFEHSAAFEVLEVIGGHLAVIADAPVLVTADKGAIVTDFSSPYGPLAQFYDIDLTRILEDADAKAARVSGAAVALCDDISPPNYCHWLLDELPRLAFLGERRDVSVIVSGPTPKWKTESLALCGFDPRRLVRVPNFEAVRADRLLVSRDIHAMQHPAHKAAPWALNFLRGRMGLAAFAATPGPAAGQSGLKLYISRGDAGGRRVLNEAAVMERLRPLGYRAVTPGRLSVAEQVTLFARASHVVGLHGAALANFAFAPPGAQMVEIFPATYGMASYYLLAAGQGCPYASYVEGDVRPGPRAQLDDIVLDIESFMRCCGAWL